MNYSNLLINSKGELVAKGHVDLPIIGLYKWRALSNHTWLYDYNINS